MTDEQFVTKFEKWSKHFGWTSHEELERAKRVWTVVYSGGRNSRDAEIADLQRQLAENEKRFRDNYVKIMHAIPHVHTDSCYSKVPETEGTGEYLSCGLIAGAGAALDAYVQEKVLTAIAHCNHSPLCRLDNPEICDTCAEKVRAAKVNP